MPSPKRQLWTSAQAAVVIEGRLTTCRCAALALLQDSTQLVLSEAVNAQSHKLKEAAISISVMAAEDLAAAAEVYGSEGSLGTDVRQEDEGLFACRQVDRA